MARMLKAGTVSVPTTPTSKGALHSRRKAYSSRLHQQERWVWTVGSLKKETVADLIYYALGYWSNNIHVILRQCSLILGE